MTTQDVQFTFPSNAAAVRETMGRKVSTANSKMPGSSFATDPFQCNVGSQLRDVEGSVCSKCYAIRLAKMRPSVRQGYAANEAAMRDASMCKGIIRERFVQGMADQIRRAAVKTGELYHRWFDAGDLSSADELELIADIARETPEIAHWLPTREVSAVRDYCKRGALPDNLTVRISATMIDAEPNVSRGMRANNVQSSTVHTKGRLYVGHCCPASQQGNSCGDCRACWNRNVSNVSYPAH